jgi:glycopeptide antibiotics resistance protein
MSALYTSHQLNAVSQMLRKLLMFGILGSLLAGSPRQQKAKASNKIFLAAAVLGAALFAAAIEVLQLWLPPHVPDFTDVMFGILGVSVGLVVVTWLKSNS